MSRRCFAACRLTRLQVGPRPSSPCLKRTDGLILGQACRVTPLYLSNTTLPCRVTPLYLEDASLVARKAEFRACFDGVRIALVFFFCVGTSARARALRFIDVARWAQRYRFLKKFLNPHNLAHVGLLLPGLDNTMDRIAGDVGVKWALQSPGGYELAQGTVKR